MKKILLILLLPAYSSFAQQNINKVEAARTVISRSISPAIAKRTKFEMLPADSDKNPTYEYGVSDGKLIVKGNSVVAMCHGFYEYLKSSNQGMITWSGKNLQIKPSWETIQSKHVTSPYRYHYYMNVVVPGYTSAYWDWDRWQKELDWMALHGMDMPMLNNAYEAIMFKVFKQIGLPESVTKKFFTGPAFQPWNRMGNITGWDAPPPTSWYTKQVALTHKVLNRMKALGMKPIIPSFAGFVPNQLADIYPSAKITPLIWNSSFPKQNRCGILLPDSTNAALFIKIGKLFVVEWEKEFGKGEFFSSDCFNEMHVPRTANENEVDFQKQLSGYGSVVYQSLKQADRSAIWVMQAWTFGYQRSEWNTSRLSSLVSKVPDDKVLFLDYANDYNLDFWNISPNWEYYNGFFNKKWIYAFLPNAGGKVPWNGVLKTYAEAPVSALNYAGKGNLVGFGFAPEGIENNELIYELLSDMGWRDKKIDLDTWLKSYCIQRYGGYPSQMKKAYQCFLQSCYGTFTDHPRFSYQLSAAGKGKGTVNDSPQFMEGVKLFLSCSDALKKSTLYKNDVIELTAQYLSLVSDSIIKKALEQSGTVRYRQLDKAYSLLNQADKLLESHPNDRLERWLNYAKQYGDNMEEQHYYMQDARRIITTWGPGVNDYSARMWSGLISSYYVQRMKLTYDAERDHKKFDVEAWQENWIRNGPSKYNEPFKNPIATAKKIIANLN